MSDLVNQDASQVQKSRGTSWKSRVVKKDPVIFGMYEVRLHEVQVLPIHHERVQYIITPFLGWGLAIGSLK